MRAPSFQQDMKKAQAEETKWFDEMVIKEFEKKVSEQQAILHQVPCPKKLKKVSMCESTDVGGSCRRASRAS